MHTRVLGIVCRGPCAAAAPCHCVAHSPADRSRFLPCPSHTQVTKEEYGAVGSTALLEQLALELQVARADAGEGWGWSQWVGRRGGSHAVACRSVPLAFRDTGRGPAM